MFEFLLWSVFVIALATALVALSCVMAGKEYDKWKADMNAKGIEWPVQGVTEVSYREIPSSPRIRRNRR
jgi:hypothetical protein